MYYAKSVYCANISLTLWALFFNTLHRRTNWDAKNNKSPGLHFSLWEYQSVFRIPNTFFFFMPAYTRPQMPWNPDSHFLLPVPPAPRTPTHELLKSSHHLSLMPAENAACHPHPLTSKLSMDKETNIHNWNCIGTYDAESYGPESKEVLHHLNMPLHRNHSCCFWSGCDTYSETLVARRKFRLRCAYWSKSRHRSCTSLLPHWKSPRWLFQFLAGKKLSIWMTTWDGFSLFEPQWHNPFERLSLGITAILTVYLCSAMHWARHSGYRC